MQYDVTPVERFPWSSHLTDYQPGLFPVWREECDHNIAGTRSALYMVANFLSIRYHKLEQTKADFYFKCLQEDEKLEKLCPLFLSSG